MPKLDKQEFDALIDRVRAGEQQAASDLVRLFEPEIRREVRLRLTSAQMRQTLDSMDICQSVFGRFFVKAALGELDFDQPQQLLRLLCQMARNKVIDCHRKARTRRVTGDQATQLLGEHQPTAVAETPSQQLMREELLEQISRLLTDEENEIARHRRDGKSWPQVADAMGASADALRKILERARERVLTQLDIED